MECIGPAFVKIFLPSTPTLLLIYNIAIQTINDIKFFCSVGFYDKNQEINL